MASEIFCPTCGYPNDAARGACLMCYEMVKGLQGGTACSSCGADNPKAASFCTACQASIDGAAAALQRPDVSGLVAGVAAGAVVAEAGEYADDVDFGEPAVAISEESALDVDAPPPPPAGDFAPPPPPGADEFEDDFASLPTADTGEIIVPPAPDTGDVMADMALDTDAAMPPPPPDTAFELDEVEGPPPPPDSVSLDLDDVESAAGDDDLGEWTLDYDE